MEDITFHPLAEIFPLIHGKEFVELKKDIQANGVHEPIVIYDGQILDGRNRFRACQETGVEPAFVTYGGNDPAGYVISLNLHRRHLNESQRSMVAANLANMESGARTDLEPTANLQEVSRAEAAEKLNVSERSVNTAKKVQKEAIPAVMEEVEQGRMAVSVAAEIAAQPKPKQEKIIERLTSGTAKNVKQAKRQVDQEERIASAPIITDSRIRIEQGDCLDLVRDMDEIPHLVITDPPYGIDTHNTRRGGHDYKDGHGYTIDLLTELTELLAGKVSQDAHLYFFSGYTLLEPLKEILSKHFDVQGNPLIWVKDNHTMCDFAQWYPRKHEYIVFCKAKGGERKLDKCVPDVLNFKRERASTHSAEKPTELLELLIEQSSIPGEIVLDPFLGSGSTGVAAKQLNRQFVGFEMDSQWLEVARSRLA